MVVSACMPRFRESVITAPVQEKYIIIKIIINNVYLVTPRCAYSSNNGGRGIVSLTTVVTLVPTTSTTPAVDILLSPIDYIRLQCFITIYQYNNDNDNPVGSMHNTTLCFSSVHLYSGTCATAGHQLDQRRRRRQVTARSYVA